MASRVDLHNRLKELTPNVYFQPPSNMTMSYPAIVYSRKDIEKLNANDEAYGLNRSYNVTVIDKNPDSPIADELLKFKYCEFDRQFVSDGINNIAFVIYY